MQEQNLAASEYFKDKERFADLMNGYVYHGQQIIHPEDILELDPVIPRNRRVWVRAPRQCEHRGSDA